MTPLYDYYEPSGKRILIYVGRIPDPKSDPGTVVSQSVLLAMYRRGLLTGEALKDVEASLPKGRAKDPSHDPD